MAKYVNTVKELSPLSEAVYKYLLTFAVGEDNAIHGVELANHFNISGDNQTKQRLIRAVRREINVSVPDVPVMSSMKGYFVPDVHASREDAIAYADKYIAPQERAAISILAECSRKRRLFGLEGQVQITSLEDGTTRVIAVSA